MFYDKILSDWGYSGIDDDRLDSAWVDSVNDYLKEIEGNDLSDDERSEREKVLLEDFEKHHPETVENVDDEKEKLKADNLKLRQQNLYNNAKNDADAAGDPYHPLVRRRGPRRPCRRLPRSLGLVHGAAPETAALSRPRRGSVSPAPCPPRPPADRRRRRRAAAPRRSSPA